MAMKLSATLKFSIAPQTIPPRNCPVMLPDLERFYLFLEVGLLPLYPRNLWFGIVGLADVQGHWKGGTVCLSG